MIVLSLAFALVSVYLLNRRIVELEKNVVLPRKKK